MRKFGLTEEDVLHRIYWRRHIRVTAPQEREQGKKEEEEEEEVCQSETQQVMRYNLWSNARSMQGRN